MVIFDIINGVKIGAKFITCLIVTLLVAMNHRFSFSTFQQQKNIQNYDFCGGSLLTEPHLIRATPVNQSYGHLAKIEDLFISFCGWGANSSKPPSHLKP